MVQLADARKRLGVRWAAAGQQGFQRLGHLVQAAAHTRDLRERGAGPPIWIDLVFLQPCQVGALGFDRLRSPGRAVVNAGLAQASRCWRRQPQAADHRLSWRICTQRHRSHSLWRPRAAVFRFLACVVHAF